MVKLYVKIQFVLFVMPHIHIFMIITVVKDNFSVRYVLKLLLQVKELLHHLFLFVPIVDTLSPKRDRKHFRVHTCVNKKCSYYLANLRALPKDLNPKLRYKYKLHYVYREFMVDFFSMDLNQLPSWVTSFKFRKNNAHIMGLCLTYHVMVASYSKTAAVLIKPFVDSYDYKLSNNLAADETILRLKV